jgi:hypothetical protein
MFSFLTIESIYEKLIKKYYIFKKYLRNDCS